MAARKRRHQEQMPGWVWMLFGLSIGLAVAVVVYLRSGAAGPDLGEILRPPVASTESPADRKTPEPEPAATATDPGEPEAAAATESDSSGEPVNDLEFYELLRQLEVAIPEAKPGEDRAQMSPGVYQIQAGSFRTFEEADRQQARLALLGIESHVERAIVDNQLWHRVIIGPLTELEEIDRVLRRLREARIDTLPPRPVAD